MAIVINQAMLDKLTHKILEIRIRTLHSIDNKVKRKLWENVDIKFSAPALFKYLIRWFGQTPICEETLVLDLMSMLMASEYALEIVKFFTPERIIKELKKIRVLIGAKPSFEESVKFIIMQVSAFLPAEAEQAESQQSIDLTSEDAVQSADIFEGDEAAAKLSMQKDAAGRRQKLLDALELQWKGEPELYVTCWETPTRFLENGLASFNDSLLLEEHEHNLALALNYVIPYTKDYPAEFFLQPPYICLSLFRLIRQRHVSVRTGFEMLLNLVEALKKRVRQRCVAATYTPSEDDIVREKTQISNGAFAFELFQLGLELLKELPADADMLSSNMVLIVLDQITTFSLEDTGSLLENLPSFRFCRLRNDLGYLLKHFRQEWESNSKNSIARTRYRMVLQIMLDFINHWRMVHEEGTEDAGPSASGTAAAAAAATDGGGGGAGRQLGLYNHADFATMNSTGHQRALEETDETWQHELHLALLDYPLKKACPDVYQNVLSLTSYCKEYCQKMRDIDDLSYLLVPAVELLQGGPGALDMTADELLAIGPDAMKTLFLHRSFGLMRMVMNAVGKCASSVTEDGPLWDAMESITVRLLADRDEEIRCEAYKLCTDMMKSFIVQLDEGDILMRRSLSSKQSPKLRSLGIPLTLQIITEITCFGYTSKNSQIRQCAATMLQFICNTKLFLREKWPDVLEILLPIAPLLQTATIGMEASSLRKVVIGMFHPELTLPWCDMLQGNLRMLFHADRAIREEALMRVLYLLRTAEQSDAKLTPQIDNIDDTVPHDLCLVKMLYDPRRQLLNDVYEVSAVRALLESLEQPDGDPGLRRSTLTQLNVMAEDPVLCGVIHNASGWPLVLKALYNALRDDHTLDYPDAAIPAIGILTKLCFSVVTFRRFLGTNENAYILIVRALLSFHHMPVFRVECSALLYLLLFADCSTGAGPMVSLPALCNTSAFKIPFVCQFHWQQSPFLQTNLLEVVLQGRPAIGGHAPEGGQDCQGESILRIGERVRSLQGEGGNETQLSQISAAGSTTYQEYVMRYIRFAFADRWFNGVSKILKAVKAKHGGLKMAENGLAPIEYSGRVVGAPAFQFDSVLRLTKHDLRWLKMVDGASTLRKAVRQCSTAKSHTAVYACLATLEANLFFPVDNNPFPDQQLIIDTLQRYFVSLPATPTDQQLLVEIFSTIGNLIDLEQERIRDWIVRMLSTPKGNNLFTKLLASEATTPELYAKTIDLLRVVLRSLPEPSRAGEKDGRQNDWCVGLLHTVYGQLDDDMEHGNYVRVVSLVNLLDTVSQRTTDWKRVDAAKMIPKLLYHIRGVRSINYIGSTIVRSLLIVIRRLLHSESVIEAFTQFRLISTQCCHSCPVIRATAWNILARIATSFKAAAKIVQDCAYVPGGIHASCVSTLLDPSEACLVRESAAYLLANLFLHIVDKSGTVQQSVLPLDHATRSNAVGPAPENLDLVVVLLAKQCFFEETARLLKQYTADEFLTGDGVNDEPRLRTLVSSDLVKGYARIHRALLEVQAGGFGRLMFEKGSVQALVECIGSCTPPPTRPSTAHWGMIGEVCTLLHRCSDEPDQDAALSRVLANAQPFFEHIINLLQPTKSPEGGSEQSSYAHAAMVDAMMRIIILLNALVLPARADSSVSVTSWPLIEDALQQAPVKSIVRLIEEGILSEDYHFQFACLNFLPVLVYSDEREDARPFLKRLDTVNMHEEDDADQAVDDDEKSNGSFEQTLDWEENDEDTENTNPNPSTTKTVVDGKKCPPPPKDGGKREKHLPPPEATGSGYIFNLLLEQYKLIDYDCPQSGGFGRMRMFYLGMQVLLRASRHCRALAWKGHLLTALLEQFQLVNEVCLDRLSYGEFVRRHGEEKKAPYVLELLELLKIMLCWLCLPVEVECLTQEHIAELCRTVLLFWPWFSSNNALERKFLELLVVLSQHSYRVCQSLTATFSGFPHSIMKLLIVMATTETARVRGPKCETRALRLTLRVLMNCCCCLEGRSMIERLHLLDNIAKLHPSVTKLQKPWVEVTRMWLEFWEMYTRSVSLPGHTGGNDVKHLTVLGALMRKADRSLRVYVMAIIRNMTFSTANRAALLASSEYMSVLQSALQPTVDHVEQLVAAVTVCKLITDTYKGRAAIKASPLVRHIAALAKHYSGTKDKEKHVLWKLLVMIISILQG